MIDVGAVAANTLWILGLSLLLAVVSWAYWRAREEGIAMRGVLARMPLRRGVDLALLLFCAGLATTSRRRWEQVVWGVLGLSWGIQAALVGWGIGRDSQDPHD